MSIVLFVQFAQEPFVSCPADNVLRKMVHIMVHHFVQRCPNLIILHGGHAWCQPSQLNKTNVITTEKRAKRRDNQICDLRLHLQPLL